ncbi:rho GTPase-activating protein 39 isoform X3 [Colossoma macropomum]|uniref:rho GTPase-activating protein 39 isoform X3 n=1 Tax=Colossoma macropomum TaxID=42526 RepID=UPI0018645363|nr:rho GTPase-activating protein 39 isoform X3 [Colossoma macropomum]
MAGTSADWVEILEPRSREHMYVNLATGECGWDPPADAPVRQADGNQWWELFDTNSGRFYYYNSTGRLTVWHRPQGADIVPLSQLQAIKRCAESEHKAVCVKERQYGSGSTGSQGRRTPQPPTEPFTKELKATEKETKEQGTENMQQSENSMDSSKDSLREEHRDTAQRRQPPLGAKAPVLGKVNSFGRNQTKGTTGSASLQLPINKTHSKANGLGACTLNPAGVRSAENDLLCTQAYKTTPAGKMAADTGQAHHLRKGSNFSCLVTSSDPVPHQASLGVQSCTPRPVSPHCGATARLYDDPLTDSPIYDEPPIDMEVEGAHLQNGLSRHTYSLQNTKFLQHPGQTLPGSRHKRNPSASDYSPAGLECIKHMVNVDLKQALLSTSPALSPGLSASSGPESVLPQQVRKEPVSLEKKQSWRLLEAGVLRAMEVHHSRRSSQVSQDYSTPPPPTGTYQDSGYSTGPSPSLHRKSRRRMGAGIQGRPGSVGSTGELCSLNERLMAEMREVVSRSNTLRETKESLDLEMLEGCSVKHSHSSLHSPRRVVGGMRCSSKEDIVSSSRSLSRSGNHASVTLTTLEIPGRQKRTYEKVDTLEKSINSQVSLSSPETPGPPSQAGMLDSKGQLKSRNKSMVDGRTASLGPPGSMTARAVSRESFHLSYATLRQPPLPDTGMADWASKHLNLHTQGLFRRRISIANMLSWNRGSIKKPMLVTTDRTVRKEACEMFKLVQAYMGDRPSRLDRRHAALLIVTKCWGMQGLRDELYVQLVRQTTGNTSPRSLAAGWELMAVSLAFFAPSPKFCCYLEGYIQRHMDPASDKKREFLDQRQVIQFILDQQDFKKKNSKSRKKRKQNTEEEEDGFPISTYAKYCYRKLKKVAVTGGKKGLCKPTLEEVDHSRRAIITPSLFGSSLEEVMERQSELFPDRKLPWVQVQLSQYVLALGGAQTEGIFRVPGDIDEVNALKLQVDQWRIPENLSDPNVPASLMKLWYRELEEPLIPLSFYKQCVSNCDDPVAAINVVQSLPDLNRLVLCYFIHFLQVFAQPANVSVTKMDVNNLAMVMAPNCLRCQSDDPRVIFENTRKEMAFLRMLIVHLDTSFIEGIM